MRKNVMFTPVLVLLFFVSLLNAQEGQVKVSKSAGTSKKSGLETQKDKVSYSIGWDIGSNIKRSSIDINPNILAKGLKDALSGTKSSISDEEMKQAMDVLKKEMQAKQTETQAKMEKERAESGDKNKKEGEEFLAKNKMNKGVKVMPSGLQYRVITGGKGEKPKPTDTVTVNYEGRLINGKVFDSSYERGQPATFAVNGVIPGWTEALQLMKVGSKYEVFIPSNIAYGERGAGGDIGPNSTLIFTVELISIEKIKQ